MSDGSSGLAVELSACWRELGGVLASRRLLAAISGGAEARLTPTKLRALDLLAAGQLRIGDLAAGMAIDETTATRLVDRLEAAGLAARERDPGDRRATVVALTTEGAELVSVMTQRRLEFFRDVLDALDPAEQSELVRLTAKATAALHARSRELAPR